MLAGAARLAEARRPGEREHIESEIARHARAARTRTIRRRLGRGRLRRHRLLVGAIIENAAAIVGLGPLRQCACRQPETGYQHQSPRTHRYSLERSDLRPHHLAIRRIGVLAVEPADAEFDAESVARKAEVLADIVGDGTHPPVIEDALGL